MSALSDISYIITLAELPGAIAGLNKHNLGQSGHRLINVIVIAILRLQLPRYRTGFYSITVTLLLIQAGKYKNVHLPLLPNE